jgi:hypothetical protein
VCVAVMRGRSETWEPSNLVGDPTQREHWNESFSQVIGYIPQVLMVGSQRPQTYTYTLGYALLLRTCVWGCSLGQSRLVRRRGALLLLLIG